MACDHLQNEISMKVYVLLSDRIGQALHRRLEREADEQKRIIGRQPFKN